MDSDVDSFLVGIAQSLPLSHRHLHLEMDRCTYSKRCEWTFRQAHFSRDGPRQRSRTRQRHQLHTHFRWNIRVIRHGSKYSRLRGEYTLNAFDSMVGSKAVRRFFRDAKCGRRTSAPAEFDDVSSRPALRESGAQPVDDRRSSMPQRPPAVMRDWFPLRSQALRDERI